MKLPSAISFKDVPEAEIPERHKVIFSGIASADNVVLVRGKFLNEWRTFIAFLYDEKDEAVSVQTMNEYIKSGRLIRIIPTAILMEKEDLVKCKSPEGEPIIFDEIQLTQKPN